jgi:hypothetical protein
MDKAFRIVIPSPLLTVILSKAKNLFVSLRTGSVRDFVFSDRDCHVASLLAMTALKNRSIYLSIEII